MIQTTVIRLDESLVLRVNLRINTFSCQWKRHPHGTMAHAIWHMVLEGESGVCGKCKFPTIASFS